METLLVNAIGTTRDATLDGIDYLVVPASMIVPGVLNGSQGPILYTGDENRRSVDQWNGMPVTINHPKDKLDNPVSARSPSVLKGSGIGSVYNTHVDDEGVLKAEAWINKTKANKLDKRILSLLGNGEPIELSTGLGLEAIELDEPVTTNSGTSCTLKAHNYRPDHLAILLDTVGACSVADGCGLLVNCECGGTKGCVCQAAFHLTSNEMSHSDLHGSLSTELRGRLSQDEPSAWIMDVFDAFIIYEQGGELFKISYSKTTEGSVTLGSESPQKVRRETTFVTANEEITPMATETLVNQVIQNCACWSEDDKDVLNGLEDAKLQSFISDAEAKTKADGIREAAEAALQEGVSVGNSKLVYNFEDKTWESQKPKKEETKVENEDKPQELTLENFLDIAPPEVKALISNTINSNNKQKADLIDALVANVEEGQQESYQAVLNKLELDELNAISNLVETKSVENTEESNIRSFFGLNASKPSSKKAATPPQDLLRPLDWSDLD